MAGVVARGYLVVAAGGVLSSIDVGKLMLPALLTTPPAVLSIALDCSNLCFWSMVLEF